MTSNDNIYASIHIYTTIQLVLFKDNTFSVEQLFYSAAQNVGWQLKLLYLVFK